MQEEEHRSYFSLNDLYRQHTISAVQWSPTGKQIVCVITDIDEAQNCTRDYICLLDTQTKVLTRIHQGASPAWSPDGSELAYTSEEGDLCIYHLAHQKSRLLTKIHHSAYFINHLEDKSLCWSPDGKYIAYLSTEPRMDTPRVDTPRVDTPRVDTPRADAPGVNDEPEQGIKVFNRLLYKTKGGRGRPFYSDDDPTHIYLISTEQGEPRLITAGDYHEHSISWSPNSLEIAFVSNRSTDPDNHQCSDLWKVNVKTKALSRLTNDSGFVFQPAWSHDGKSIAYLATRGQLNTNDSMADDTHLYLMTAEGGNVRCLTQSLDRRVENISWHPKQNLIYFTVENEGKKPVYLVSAEAAQLETVIEGDFFVLEYALSPEGEKIAWLKTETTQAPEIFISELVTQKSTQLTKLHEAWLQQTVFLPAEAFWFQSFDDTPIQGWLMRPANFNEDKSYPLALVIHGGPHNMFGFEYEERMQLLAAHGYAVLFINPRGSSGYGQKFSRGNVLNWGGGDYKDLMGGLDHVLAQQSWIDADKLVVTGQSYGGYMTNWIITQTRRFKAAVVDAGISNLISFSGTSIYHSLIEAEFEGEIYQNFPLLWHWSPLRNVKQVNTPTLFLHGELDNEVPFSQAEEMYVALKKCGVETRLVQYQGEGHGWRPPLKPNNKYDLYSRMLDWFDSHI